MTEVREGNASPWANRAMTLGLLFVVELALVSLAYQVSVNIECRLTDHEGVCNAFRSLALRALVVLGVAAFLVRAWPGTFGEFLRCASTHRNRIASGLHALGLALIMLPLGLFWGEDLSARFGSALVFWVPGAALAIAGGLLWLAPVEAWTQLFWTRTRSAIPILVLAALVPDLVYQVLPLWNWEGLARLTFDSVATTLGLIGADASIEYADYIIGIGDFYVSVAPQCSGVEGFALVTAFIAIYAFIFRSEVRMTRFILVMLPFAILCSWLLNILRITLLILIGARISPEIAVNGFHSYAGWLMFTALAFGLTALAQTVPWLHREGFRVPPRRPLRSDLVAAQLLPFAAFMVIGTLAAALSPHPGLGLPFGSLVLGLVLLYFLPALRCLDWQPDLPALAAGLIVGIGWILSAPSGDAELEWLLAAFPAWGFILWATARILVTATVVPIIEENFFRGYLLTRLDGPELWRRALAIAVSSLTFALLHGRWLEAGIAGVVFALVALRRGRVADAIWSHIVANSVVAMAAAMQGDWSLI